jgi:hypothetical protein
MRECHVTRPAHLDSCPNTWTVTASTWTVTASTWTDTASTWTDTASTWTVTSNTWTASPSLAHPAIGSTNTWTDTATLGRASVWPVVAQRMPGVAAPARRPWADAAGWPGRRRRVFERDPPGAMGNHARPGRWTWTSYANTWAHPCGRDALTGQSFEQRRESMGGMLGKTPWPAPPSSTAVQHRRPAPEALPGATRILRLATSQRQFDTPPQDASSRAVVRSFATGRSTATATRAPGDIETWTVGSRRAARRSRQSCTH